MLRRPDAIQNRVFWINGLAQNQLIFFGWYLKKFAYCNKLTGIKGAFQSIFRAFLSSFIMVTKEEEVKKPTINSFDDIHPVLSKTLHSLPASVEKFVSKIEGKTGVARENATYAFTALLALYLMFGSEAGFVCNFICFAYPAYISLHIVDDQSTANTLKWVLYWVVFGTFTVFDRFADNINGIFPVYWLLKCAFCTFLFLPQTDGTTRFRAHILSPIFKLLHRKPREIASLIELEPEKTAGSNPAVPKKSTPIQAKVANKVDMVRKAHLPVFFIIGGPGAGKGTQCGKMVEKYGLTHLSTGDLLRAEVESSKASAAELKKIIQSGELVPASVVLDLLKEAMTRATINGSKGFLIDGYPREVIQARDFEREVAAPDLVLYFEVTEKILIERCVNRAKETGVARIDDNIETVMKRLKTYETASAPVIDYYKERGKLVVIPAEDKPEAIFATVEGHLDKIMTEVLQQQQE